MKKLTLTLAAAALALGSMVLSASAQGAGAASMHALSQNATPIITHVACGGPGPYCPPGFTRACGPYRCWCRPCY